MRVYARFILGVTFKWVRDTFKAYHTYNHRLITARLLLNKLS